MLWTRWRSFKRLRLLGIVLTTALVWIISPDIAQAQPPTNDDFDSPVVISSIPFQTTLVTTEATSAADDPDTCRSTNQGSVWFTFTPTRNTIVDMNTFGSDYDTVLAAYTGSRGATDLVPVACGDDSGASVQSRIAFRAVEGTSYHIMVAVCCNSSGSGGGNLTLSAAEPQPPANDNFADTVTVPSIPFVHTVDITAATRETGEPTPSCGTLSRSVWYSFTSSETESVTTTAWPDRAGGLPILAVYTGSSISSLHELGCRNFFPPIVFRAVAGQTYYLQLGDDNADASVLRFTMDPAAAVHADFFYGGNLSIFGPIIFFDRSSDPDGSPIVAYQWQFGDGSSSTGNESSVNHTYAADGDYLVQLTVTTADGRTASVSHLFVVRTHDVTIDRFTVPRSAHAGQTRTVKTFVKSNRYDETVRVELYKSASGGFVQIGSLTQSVAHTASRTTEFPFDYTFTSDDAATEKVTFKAVAVIIDAYDSLPTDNEVVATPTRVTRR